MPSSVTQSSTWLAQTASSFRIFGSFATTDTSQVSVSLSTGSCSVTAMTSSTLDCTLSGSLQLGPLNATFTHAGATTASKAVAQVITPPVVTATSNRFVSVASSSLSVSGSGFVAGSDISIALFPVGNTCSNLQVLSSSQLFCTVALSQAYFGALPAPLNASVTQGKVSSNNVVATVVAGAALASRPSFRVTDRTPSMDILGGGFVPSPNHLENVVGFAPAGNCSVFSASNTAITCNLTNLVAGPLTAQVTVGGVTTKKRTFVDVATVYKQPSITQASLQIGFNTTVLTINGADFATPFSDNVLAIYVASNTTVTFSCPVIVAQSSSTQLICNASAITFSDFPTASVSAEINLYGGPSFRPFRTYQPLSKFLCRFDLQESHPRLSLALSQPVPSFCNPRRRPHRSSF